jgi:hypothetical protein
MMNDDEWARLCDAKYDQIGKLLFEIVTKDAQTPDNQPLRLYAIVVTVLQLAGEMEALVNLSTMPGTSRLDHDKVYDIYTDGYNDGFRRAVETRERMLKEVKRCQG